MAWSASDTAQPLGVPVPQSTSTNVPNPISKNPNQFALENGKETPEKLPAGGEDIKENPTFTENLSTILLQRWWDAKYAKEFIKDEMLQSSRQRQGKYDPDKLNAILRQGGGSQIFMMLTSVKCRAATAWIKDVLIPSNDKPWSLEPTPIPDLPEDVIEYIKQSVMKEFAMSGLAHEDIDENDLYDGVEEFAQNVRDEILEEKKEEAKIRARRAEEKMWDEMLEGGWVDAFVEVINDVVTFKAGIIKGPYTVRKPALKWVEDKWEIKNEYRREYKRISPFDFYPAPDSENIHNSYVFERVRMSRLDLTELIGVKGFKESAIREVLKRFGDEGYRGWLNVDFERDIVENRKNQQTTKSYLIDGLVYWGSASGRMLKRWGIKGVKDQDKEYQIEAWIVANIVIKVELNPDPIGRKPYGMASYENIPGSIWGMGVPEIMRDVQDMVNATARQISNNMGIASGPQVVVNVDKLPPGENIEDIHPWKIWSVEAGEEGDVSKAINFVDAPMHIGELQAAYFQFSAQADEQTGIPKYAYGEGGSGGGAGSTASGLAMLMGASAKGIKSVISHLDQGIIKPCVERHYYQLMRFDEDESIKGDAKIVPKGAISLIQSEITNSNRMNFLATTANPLDSQIIGEEGRANLLRDVAQGTLDMPQGSVVPSEDEADQQRAEREQQMMMAQQIQAGMSQGAPQGAPQGIAPQGPSAPPKIQGGM